MERMAAFPKSKGERARPEGAYSPRRSDDAFQEQEQRLKPRGFWVRLLQCSARRSEVEAMKAVKISKAKAGWRKKNPKEGRESEVPKRPKEKSQRGSRKRGAKEANRKIPKWVAKARVNEMNFDEMRGFLIKLEAYSDKGMADAALTKAQRSEVDAKKKRRFEEKKQSN